MIRTLVWKDYREHRSIWLALAFLATALIIGCIEMLDPAGVVPYDSEKHYWLIAIACFLAGTYGLICGAMMFAGERESRTLAFLDSLTGRRGPVWRTKLLFGILLVLAYALALDALVLSFGIRLLATTESIMLEGWFWFFLLALIGLITFIWGLLFSSLFDNVVLAVTAAGMAMLLLPLFSVFVGAALFGLGEWTGIFTLSHDIGAAPAIIVFAGATLLAIYGSWRFFCQADFARAVPAPRVSFAPAWRLSLLSGWKRTLWLTWRQGWALLLLLVFVAPLMGVALCFVAPASWLLIPSFVGIVCGMAGFAGEQTGGSRRFLADQRLSLGWIWTFKTLFGCGCGLMISLLVLFLSSSLPQTQFEFSAIPQPHTQLNILLPVSLTRLLFGNLGPGFCLLVFLLYGLSVAQLLTLVLRKTIGAVVLAIPITALLLLLWLPSMIVGGISAWHILVIPLLLLGTSRLIIWAWASDVLYSRRPLLLLMTCLALCTGWLGGSLWLRAVEIPALDEPFDAQAFEAKTRVVQQNQTSRLIHEACEEVHALNPHGIDTTGNAPGRSPGETNGTLSAKNPWILLTNVIDLGEPWPTNDSTLKNFMNDQFSHSWPKKLREAAELPLGTIRMPQMSHAPSKKRDLPGALTAIMLLRGRSVQVQKNGDGNGALDPITSALALSRSMRHLTAAGACMAGQGAEQGILATLKQWRGGVTSNAQLLKRGLGELTRHEALVPPLSEAVKADYIAFRKSFVDPRADMPVSELNLPINQQLQIHWLALACAAPWEQERMTRIGSAILAERLAFADADFWKIWPGGPSELTHQLWRPAATTGTNPNLSSTHLARVVENTTLARDLYFDRAQEFELHAKSQLRLRLARLQFAAAIFANEKKRPPKAADELVPQYLSELPINPLTGNKVNLEDEVR